MNAAEAVTAASAAALAMRLLALWLQARRVRRLGRPEGSALALEVLGGDARAMEKSWLWDMAALWLVVPATAVGSGLGDSVAAVAAGAAWGALTSGRQPITQRLRTLARGIVMGAAALAVFTFAPGTWWIWAWPAFAGAEWVQGRREADRAARGRPEGWDGTAGLPQEAIAALAAAGLRQADMIVSARGRA